MKNALETGQVATPSNQATSFFWLENTLDCYEVEELDGHELAKMLSQTTMRTAASEDPQANAGFLN